MQNTSGQKNLVHMLVHNQCVTAYSLHNEVSSDINHFLEHFSTPLVERILLKTSYICHKTKLWCQCKIKFV